MQIRKEFQRRSAKYECATDRHRKARRALQPFNPRNDSTTFGTDKKCELTLGESPATTMRPKIYFDSWVHRCCQPTRRACTLWCLTTDFGSRRGKMPVGNMLTLEIHRSFIRHYSRIAYDELSTSGGRGDLGDGGCASRGVAPCAWSPIWSGLPFPRSTTMSPKSPRPLLDFQRTYR